VNKIRFVAAGIALGMGLGIAAVAGAIGGDDDPIKVGPGIYKLKHENDKVRVSEIRFKPGDKIAMHSHPGHFVYVLTPGTLKLSYPDGRATDFIGKTGDIVWIDAESHAAVNTGSTEFSALVVELK
jgi:quercetin dioxygenase-like cupin family protein